MDGGWKSNLISANTLGVEQDRRRSTTDHIPCYFQASFFLKQKTNYTNPVLVIFFNHEQAIVFDRRESLFPCTSSDLGKNLTWVISLLLGFHWFEVTPRSPKAAQKSSLVITSVLHFESRKLLSSMGWWSKSKKLHTLGFSQGLQKDGSGMKSVGLGRLPSHPALSPHVCSSKQWPSIEIASSVRSEKWYI